MPSPFSLIESLCAAASVAMALQSLLLILALISRPRRSPANLALALALFAFLLAMLRDVIRYWGADIEFPRYFWVASKLPVAFIPPFAYLHIAGLKSGAVWRFGTQDMRHVAPSLILSLLCVIGAVTGSDFIAGNLEHCIFAVTILQGAFYLAAVFRLTAGGESPQSAWLRLLIWGLAGFLLMHGVITGIGYSLGYVPYAQLAAHLFTLAVLYAISFASLSHGKVFERPPNELFQELVAPLGKYRKSRQSAQDAKRLLAKLDHAVASGSLYREAALTLPILAAKVGAHPNLVSQALNQTLGVGFFDYINTHRIAEAKRLLLAANGDGTILDIAYAVGFNSKSTFNAAFKKQTGQTPSLFRKSTSLQGRTLSPRSSR